MAFNRDIPEGHNCSQGATLATICSQLDNIQSTIKEIREDQKESIETQKQLAEKVTAMDRDIASRPTATEQRDNIKKVQAHDIYFAIIYTITGILIAILIGLATGVIEKIIGN